ncbi:hypothetical protein PHO31112_02183 [Pandoraea horticolens]|uniref:GlcNAc-PI de-N-acetylase n=1 Tax=Pandoraea horticolens TaxID=2508298 RepID=A0A5E4UPN6_9BURK|nr:hypothetical protein PHO31112_02183 [Pandoraea horticolens]
MVTENTLPSPLVTVFLFAHQDDEYGVYELIHQSVCQGRQVMCIYFTTGVRSTDDPSTRNRESLAVLNDMGVPADNVIFAGAALGISDLNLHRSLREASDWFEAWLLSHSHIDEMFVTAWEGGHPDHDSLHAIAVHTCVRVGIANVLRQYSLYNAFNRPKPFFRVLAPLPHNGRVDLTSIPWSRRLRFLKYTLRYSSQRGSWVGLFPFMLLHYVLRGTQAVQGTSVERLQERPHDGPLYYEHRKFATWPDVRSRIQEWRAQKDNSSIADD